MERSCCLAFSKKIEGFALILLLSCIAFLSLLLLFFVPIFSAEKTSISLLSSSYQASEAAESGLAAAVAQLSLATSTHSTFLVGITNSASTDTPLVIIGATNLTNSAQLMPLVSGNLKLLSDYPASSPEAFQNYLQGRSLPAAVDLNKKNHPIGSSGAYPASWILLTNSTGKAIARYAYIMLDEQARLNPSLHQTVPRTDPLNWDQGPQALPLTLTNHLLLSEKEATAAYELSSTISTLEGFEQIFTTPAAYDSKKIILTTASEALPDLIPATLPDGGKPKYDLNDLATNPLYGATASERAATIATIIDRNFPHFKERDPSLLHEAPATQCRYLHRLAACIVDYISPETAPTLVNGGEPAGQSLTPLPTQLAERCCILARTSNSVIIENQYFLQVWNPYTKTIPAGGSAMLSIQNRQRLLFGNAPPAPFQNYTEQSLLSSSLRPNEATVIAFPNVTQTWISPTSVPASDFPHWQEGPEGNAIPTEHQLFSFSWNGALVTMSRRPPVTPGLAQGGFEHDAASLTNTFNEWQCSFIPTEKDTTGHYRAVGDPRENYLSNYLWKSYSGAASYVEHTRWKGAMSDASSERLFSPTTTWIHRDFVPLNPPTGNKPATPMMTPDHIPSPYLEARDAPLAPFVLRKEAMNSIVELGNINDPAQADDLGAAPNAGSSGNKSSIFASGGARTLHIGQPEFSYPVNNWNVPEKRAINLIDLFTATTTNNPAAFLIKTSSPGGTPISTIWRKGLININTASHAVLTSLFSNITPTSDQRFTNSTISTATAERLATLLEEHRPFEKLSDLAIITPFLANATTYTPSLSSNVAGENLAAVFDRARQEGFGKMISLCTLQSRSFRVYILGESLNNLEQPTGESLLEASISLLPQKKHLPLESNVDKACSDTLLVPVVQKREWLR